MITCLLPPLGWTCSREAGHEGPCAARPMKCQIHIVTGDEEDPSTCDQEATHRHCAVLGAVVCEMHKCRCNRRIDASPARLDAYRKAAPPVGSYENPRKGTLRLVDDEPAEPAGSEGANRCDHSWRWGEGRNSGGAECLKCRVWQPASSIEYYLRVRLNRLEAAGDALARALERKHLARCFLGLAKACSCFACEAMRAWEEAKR